jgi:hypothetical protein
MADTDGNNTSILPLIETPSAEGKRSKSWGRGSYGANAYGGASSDTPKQRTRAALSVNRDDSDPVLNAIKHGGAKTQDGNGQTRTVNATPYPTARGMRDRSGDK